MKSTLVEAWKMSSETNLFVLRAIPSAYLKDSYSPRTRTVAAQFAHIHNVRVRWLAHAAPELVGELEGFPRGAEPTKTQLKAALKASEKAIASFLEQCDADGRVKSWNGPPASFFGYLAAHEAHHRGLAMVAMRMSGRRLPQDVVYGQWDWGKKRSLRKK
jgi:uncharacterized damage-inducible protein DinB